MGIAAELEMLEELKKSSWRDHKGGVTVYWMEGDCRGTDVGGGRGMWEQVKSSVWNV